MAVSFKMDHNMTLGYRNGISLKRIALAEYEYQ
jgi:hypothetical protein